MAYRTMTGWWAAGLAGLAAVCATPGGAEVRLPKVFASHMVLQRDIALPVWGWAAPGEAVTVRLGAAVVRATPNSRGEWSVALPAQKAGGPFTLTVSGTNTLTLEDVLVGEVWICSGQSNMEMGIGSIRDAQKEVAAATYPNIRLLMVPNRFTPEPMQDMDGVWKACTPTTVAAEGWGGFSAAGYFFGRELHKRLGVPVGLIDATWGGTVIQTWTPPVGFASVPALQADYQRILLADPTSPTHRARVGETVDATEKWVAEARKALAAQKAVPVMPVFPAELMPPHDVQNATGLYNGMIHPICPFGIRGAIWYQGESNLGEGKTYTERMKALIGGWRAVWKQGEFPFYYVQVAPYNYGGNPQTEPEFWEAQSAAQAIANSGMAVINDIGDLADIHPTNKQDVGKRLALLALAKTYGKTDVVCAGPTPGALTLEGSVARLAFEGAAAGLKSRDGGPLTWFEVIDADEGGFVKANAEIDGKTLKLSAPGVKRPVAVRYAWSMLAQPNLMNSEGLPASAFRVGDIPKRDLLAVTAPESKGYKLVYDIDLGKLGAAPTYDVDNSTKLSGEFDRIAYFIELQQPTGESQCLYVSMNAFSSDLKKIGIPTVASGAKFQQNVAAMNVYSNVKGIVTGADLAGGNIEFWPDNYGAPNPASVPNASTTAFDFGDGPSPPTDGYGCMQVHNHEAKQTLFAVNHWAAGADADMGIGNRTTGEPDWTFAANGRTYPARRLRVLVRMK